MARQEQDRENLLREAVALVRRAGIEAPCWREPVVIGFRRDGALSVYFGGQLVVQFNANGQLRRAYSNGFLYKAQQGRLIRLQRERTEASTLLVSHSLSDSEQAALIDELGNELQALLKAIEQNDYRLVGEAPVGENVPAQAAAWLQALEGTISIAARPNVG